MTDSELIEKIEREMKERNEKLENTLSNAMDLSDEGPHFEAVEPKKTVSEKISEIMNKND